MYDGHFNRDKCRYDSCGDFKTDSGLRTAKDYIKQTDKNGKSYLKEIGEFDLYDRIQSHADSVDIHSIIARFTMGDYSALNRKTLSYFDTTEAPTSLADAHRYIQNGEYLFNRLPVEVKEKFNNNYLEFVSQIGSKAWVDALSVEKSEVNLNNDVKEVSVNAES